MKRVFAILAVVALFGATSCKKDYTCTCVTEIPGMDDQTNALPINDAKKADAEEACDLMDSTGGDMMTCTL